VSGAFQGLPDPLFTFMGGRVDGVGEGRARMSIEVNDAVRNPNGRTHGSILFALLDFAMGAALYSVDHGMARTATVQMDMHFVKSAREGSLHCEAWVVRRGRLVSFAEGHIRDDAGDLVARGTATFTTAQAGQ
jgi:acyl-CoA thioesterase